MHTGHNTYAYMEYRRLLPGRLLLCLAAFSWMLATADVPAARRRPGCRTRCGDTKIQYPFGIDPGCALHSGFQLNCAPVNGGTPKLLYGDIEVTNISVPDGKAWAKISLSSQCYDPDTGRTRYSNAWTNLVNTPYWLSDEDNKIFVIGCNALAYMRSSSYRTGQTNKYIIGCSSTCEHVELKNGSCSGGGCCQADVPKGIVSYRGYFNEHYNTTAIWTKNRCNYVVVMEAAAFNFSTTYLTSTVFNDTYQGKVPVVFDWSVGWNNTCRAAKRNTNSYACVSSNSDCVDATNGLGYRCKCSNGFEGNPYITDGCKDIDECLAHPCSSGVCTNAPGRYTCTCPRGKQMIDGICVPKSTLSVGLLVGIGVGSGMGLFSLVFGITLLKQNLKKLRAKARRAKYFEQNRGFLLQQLVDKDIAEEHFHSSSKNTFRGAVLQSQPMKQTRCTPAGAAPRS